MSGEYTLNHWTFNEPADIHLELTAGTPTSPAAVPATVRDEDIKLNEETEGIDGADEEIESLESVTPAKANNLTDIQ